MFHVSSYFTDPFATPGQCGLYNLGNTCFMNAGTSLLFLTFDILFSGIIMLSAIHSCTYMYKWFMYKWFPIFCELGLQCLLSTTPLLKFFLEQFTLEDFPKDSLTTYFYQLVRKIWSGQFSIVYPRDFKSALGLFHVQFQDYRQVCLFYWDSRMDWHLLLINFHWKLICAKHAQGQVCWNKIRGLCV